MDVRGATLESCICSNKPAIILWLFSIIVNLSCRRVFDRSRFVTRSCNSEISSSRQSEKNDVCNASSLMDMSMRLSMSGSRGVFTSSLLPSLLSVVSVESEGLALESDGLATLENDGLAKVESDGLTSVERDGFVLVESDELASVERDGLASVKNDGFANVERDGLASVESDALVSVERHGLTSVESDEFVSVERDGLASVDRDGFPSVESNELASMERDGLASVDLFSVSVVILV